MLFVIPFVVFVGLFFLMAPKMGGAAAGPGSLPGGRVLAHGLVLSAASYSMGEQTQFGQKYELRELTLDVEMPGKDPYEITLTPLIPRICEGRPGAVFDLSVNPRRPGDITIIGPAGSSAWLGAAPQLTGATFAAVGNAGRYFLAFFVSGFVAFIVLGIVAGATKGGSSHATAGGSHALSGPCEAAEKCCKVVGTSTCTQFATMDTTACAHALVTEQAAATKAHKRCP